MKCRFEVLNFFYIFYQNYNDCVKHKQHLIFLKFCQLMHLMAYIKNAFVYNFKLLTWDEHSIECRFLIMSCSTSCSYNIIFALLFAAWLTHKREVNLLSLWFTTLRKLFVKYSWFYPQCCLKCFKYNSYSKEYRI